MKLILKKSIFFLPLLIAVYLLVLFIVAITPLKKFIPTIKNNTGGPGQSLLRFREAETIRNIDFLIVGSSHASKGFDNRLFSEQDISTFNLGTGLQTPQNTYYILKKYVPSMKPKKIIMELFWDVLEYENGNEACIDITSNSPLSAEMIKMNCSTKEVKPINSMLVAYLSRSLHPLSACGQEKIPGETYIRGGYVESIHNDDVARQSIANIQPRSLIMNKKQIGYLKKTILYCKAQDIPIIFVTAPVPIELLNSITNYVSVVDNINNIMHSNKTHWLNFNDTKYRDKLELNSITDFNDRNHLSQAGVLKFNSLLIRLLKNKTVF
jgi:hypothetical protein